MPSRIKTSLPTTEYEVATGDYDESRAPVIDRVIIHTEVGFRTSTRDRFDDPNSHVSAHYGINVDGSIDHYLEETFTAYQAGNYAMNQRSIGIEHEDLNKPNDPRPDILYTTSAKLVRDICLFYNIPIDRTHIRKHSEVSDLPTACPDSLDIDRIVREANNNPIDTCPADRDANWNIVNDVGDQLKIKANPDDKPGTSKAFVKAIQDLQNKVPIIITKYIETPNNTTVTVPVNSQNSILTANLPSNTSSSTTFSSQNNNVPSNNPFLSLLKWFGWIKQK